LYIGFNLADLKSAIFIALFYFTCNEDESGQNKIHKKAGRIKEEKAQL
jgi:hypothetical protein